mmetsp:Transcript_875/g.1182  ORF Transcript_875/g.1182 Transcript_875/m.1182 type:complete len:107 (+) Transcript_875:2749-3069(+)
MISLRVRVALLISATVSGAPNFFKKNVEDWSADLASLRGNNDDWEPTDGLELNGQFAWEGNVPEPGELPKDLTIKLGFELTADEAIDSDYETFIGWAFLAKGSVSD